MAPLEFTPIRRFRGSRAVPAPAGPASAPAGAAASGRGAEGPVFGRADGLWVRSAGEVEHAWRVVSGLVEQVAGQGPAELEELSPTQRYAVGVMLAAGWCVGVRPLAPLSGDRAAVSSQQVATELGLAQVVMSVRGPLWESAAGVHAWLSWITGAADRMVFRAG